MLKEQQIVETSLPYFKANVVSLQFLHLLSANLTEQFEYKNSITI